MSRTYEPSVTNFLVVLCFMYLFMIFLWVSENWYQQIMHENCIVYPESSHKKQLTVIDLSNLEKKIVLLNFYE